MEGVRVYSETSYAAEAFTNASGNYSFEDVPMGTSMVIRAEKAGYTFSPEQIIQLVVKDLFDLHFTATLQGGGGEFSVSGKVVKAGDQTPVSGVTINYDATKSVSTDANGEYSISGINNPQITLTPSKAGFMFTPQKIDLTMDRDYTGQNFTATPTGGGTAVPVTFYYNAASGNPSNVYLAGSMNSYNASDGQYRLMNQGGIFTLTVNLDPGDYVYKYVVDGDWRTDPYNPVTDGGEYGNSKITVSDPMITYLLPAFNESYSPSNLPQIKAIVATNSTSLSLANYSMKINSQAISGPRFLSNSNKTLTYTPSVAELQNGNNTCELSFTVSGQTVTKTISFQYTATGGGGSEFSVSGSVKTADATPVSGVTIDYFGGSVFTDANGDYSISGIEAPQITLTPSKAGFMFTPQKIDLTMNKDYTGQNFTAIPTGGGGSEFSVSGSIKTADATPVSGVTIDYFGGSVFTAANGNYSISGINDPQITLTPSKAGYTFSPVQIDLTMDKDYIGQNFTATLTGGGGDGFSVSGSVKTADQTPVSGVTINYDATKSVSTDANGEYFISGINDPQIRLIPSKAGYTFSPAQIDLAMNKDYTGQNFTAILQGGGGDGFSVNGRVEKAGTKEPVSGVTINYGGSRTVSTDANGNYFISGINDPVITLRPSKAGYTFSPDVSLQMDKDYTGINFTATPTTEQIPYTISGIVTVCGKPVEGAEIESRGKKSYSGADGSYSIADTVEKDVDRGWHSPMSATVNISKEGIFFPGEQSIHFSGNYDFNIDFSGHYYLDTITGKVSHGVSGQAFSGLELKWEVFLIPEGNHNNKTLIGDSVIITDNSGNYAAPFYYITTDQSGVSRDYYQYAITPTAKGYSYDRTVVLPSDRTCDDLKNQNIVATVIPVPVCMVSVSETNKNIIVWEKPLLEDAITGFKIYKEGNVANVYEVIATVPYAETAIYTDTDSDPSVKAYRYKIGTVTSYGYETELSNEHKTIHLTINKGIGNAWNLIWSHYEGLAISTYKLYRGTGKENMTFLTDIAGNLNSYTDNNAPSAEVYYQIEMVLDNACNPEMGKPLLSKRVKATDSYASTKSNIVSSVPSGVNDIKADKGSIYPNPVENILYMTRTNVDAQFEIYSGQGTLTMQGFVDESIDVSGLQTGLYYLRINANNQWITYKFIKE